LSFNSKNITKERIAYKVPKESLESDPRDILLLVKTESLRQEYGNMKMQKAIFSNFSDVRKKDQIRFICHLFN